MTEQEQLAYDCSKLINNWYKENWNIGFPAHRHLCTYKLLGYPYKLRKRLCREWVKKHSTLQEVQRRYGRGNICDYCEMLNFVCVDDEGRIAAIKRPMPEEICDRLSTSK